jgi:hypothetical protein
MMTIPVPDRSGLILPNLDPNQAKLNLQLSRMQRDQGSLSDREMAKIEQILNPQAKKSRTMYNPFTGELKKVEY